ncbi:hypothetical protein R1flu_006548 [Riccia fluitans]|uniref:Agenet domain-containing protein n=1 Tax=Riccia fluitans TaxID=41844 RepID=A0ABD1YXE1_9MARC
MRTSTLGSWLAEFLSIDDHEKLLSFGYRFTIEDDSYFACAPTTRIYIKFGAVMKNPEQNTSEILKKLVIVVLGFALRLMEFEQDKKGRVYCTAAYKDYDDSEEEILAVDVDRVTRENKLMIRPLPPPVLKESLYDQNRDLNVFYAIVRDHLDIGDLVEWWYSDCWWSAEVTSVLEDGHFQV